VRFFFLLLWIPIPFRALLLPFLPALSAGVYVTLGPARGLLALGIPVVAVHIFVDGGGGWMWLVQWVAMGPIFVESFSRSSILERAMGGAVLATLILQVSLLAIRSFELGLDPWTLLGKSIEEAVERSIQVYGSMGMDPKSVAQLRAAASELARAIVMIMPGMVVTMDLLLFWWTLLVHRRVLASLGRDRPGPPALRTWRMPFPWVWVTIAGGVLLLLPGSVLGGIGANILIVMGTLHFLQGVGVVAAFFHARDVPPFIRGILYALIFFQQVLLLVVMVIGLFDIWFDFRKRWRPADQG
jgi:uncharacterized protein YybS (DUF2232 family)